MEEADGPRSYRWTMMNWDERVVGYYYTHPEDPNPYQTALNFGVIACNVVPSMIAPGSWESVKGDGTDGFPAL